MKKILTILLATASAALAQNPTVVNEQIALQLGAIQMGYATPFVLTAGSNATVKQQACNALVQGRKAMAATAAAPGVNVQGAVNVPGVDTVEFRDQLYQAVENVVTAPLKATVSGVATLVGGKKVSARAYLMPPPNSWMVPVPYALEARSCIQCVELREELVAKGVLTDDSYESANMITVQGGTLPQSSELSGQTISTFQIGKYEVTWSEWREVMDWAGNNSYGDLAGVGSGAGDNHPVESVSWYDVVKWCNAKSEKEGLTPVYQANGATFKSGQIEPTINSAANGYRLPTDAEWEWAARGGVLSQGYTYSGSNDVDAVAWYIYNSGSTTHEIGTKASNELGIFDMSGNVWELVFDAYDGSLRRLRGTGFGNHEDSATVANRDGRVNSDYRYYEGGRNGVGFRLARSSGQ